MTMRARTEPGLDFEWDLGIMIHALDFILAEVDENKNSTSCPACGTGVWATADGLYVCTAVNCPALGEEIIG